MANRPVLRRRGVAAAAPAPEPVKVKKASKPVVEEEEEDIVEDEIDEELEPDEGEEPEEEEEPAPVIRRKVVAAPAPVAKKAVAAPPPVKKAAKPVVQIEEEDVVEEPVKKTVKVKPVDATVAGAIVLDLLDGMSEDQAITITRTADDKWTFSLANGKAAKSGLTGRAYWDEVIDPAYLAWYNDWSQMTQDERIKKAKKVGVTWVEDKDPRVNIMRATLAYREQIGIEKYKEQYRSRSARAAIKKG